MSVILKQFDGEAIAPRDDAILYNSIITRNGILDGCTITHLGANQLKITAGRGIIKGRMFEVEEMTVNCTLASSGTQRGRMYLRMELSNMENPAQIKTVAADTLPELVQEEDCNYTNGIYELELCTYDVTDTLLSNLETTYEVIDTVFPVAKTLDDVNGVTDENVLAGAVAVKELSSETDTVANKIGNIDGITNQTYNSIGALLQYYINNGYLPDINSVPLIPKLTANNSQILTDSTNQSYPAWQAFDQSSSTFFLCEGTYVGYDFLKNVYVKKITWSGYNQGEFPGFGGSAKLQASDNKSSWIDVANIPGKGTGASSEEFNVPVAQSHRYWRVNNGANFGLYSLQFYGT